MVRAVRIRSTPNSDMRGAHPCPNHRSRSEPEHVGHGTDWPDGSSNAHQHGQHSEASGVKTAEAKLVWKANV
eukprot:9033950-Alexandrium_andersonii.AAC.1